MPTSTYNLRNNYSNASKVSALDLNRRADVLAYQLPGALQVAGVDAGVMPLLATAPDGAQSAIDSVESWALASADALKVSEGGGTWNATTGAALVRYSTGGHLVWTRVVSPLSVATQIPEVDQTLYIHLALAIPDDETVMGAVDSQIGDEPTLRVTEHESESGMLLLASWDGTQLIDRREFVAPIALALAVQSLNGRVEALEAAAGGGEGGTAVSWLSQLLYNVAHPVQADVYIESRFTEVEESIAALQGGAKKFPEQSDLMMDLSATLAVGLFEVNPPAILRTQMSALGRGFGKGQNDTPDFSPDTGEANEAAYDFTSGLIRP